MINRLRGISCFVLENVDPRIRRTPAAQKSLALVTNSFDRVSREARKRILGDALATGFASTKIELSRPAAAAEAAAALELSALSVLQPLSCHCPHSLFNEHHQAVASSVHCLSRIRWICRPIRITRAYVRILV